MALDLTALSTALSALTPTQTLSLGAHLSTGNYADALGLIAQMSVSPAVASAEYGALSAIKNLPSQVLTMVGEALTLTGAAFQAKMAQATEALQTSYSSESALQQAGIG